MQFKEFYCEAEKNAVVVVDMMRSACVLGDKRSNNIQPPSVQVQCVQIESLPVFYIIFNISVESLSCSMARMY